MVQPPPELTLLSLTHLPLKHSLKHSFSLSRSLTQTHTHTHTVKNNIPQPLIGQYHKQGEQPSTPPTMEKVRGHLEDGPNSWMTSLPCVWAGHLTEGSRALTCLIT